VLQDLTKSDLPDAFKVGSEVLDLFGDHRAHGGCVPWSGVKAEACDLIGDQ